MSETMEPDGYLMIEVLNLSKDISDEPTITTKVPFIELYYWNLEFGCLVLGRKEGRSYIPLHSIVSFDVHYNSDEYVRETEASRDHVKVRRG